MDLLPSAENLGMSENGMTEIIGILFISKLVTHALTKQYISECFN
jgi:hypothetical protein